jgi:DNA sulfur modification protein DndB
MPEWYELAVRENERFDPNQLPSHMEGVLGFLVFDGSEDLFAVDGQHRVVGIKKALERVPDRGSEEVATIFVGHQNNPAGLERTRRLFTTLNRYAKPVSTQEKIALDEDDVVAIVTRQLLEEYPLFRDKVSIAKSKPIPVTDHQNFTTVVTVYDVMDVYLRDKTNSDWRDFKRSRPTDSAIESFYSRGIAFWRTMAANFDALTTFQSTPVAPDAAARFRSRAGGHLLFRPIGLMIVVRVVRRLMDSGLTLDDVIGRVAHAPMMLQDPPWTGLLWDPGNRRMVTAPENQRLAEKLLAYMVGVRLEALRTTEQRVRSELAGFLNQDPSVVSLPPQLAPPIE